MWISIGEMEDTLDCQDLQTKQMCSEDLRRMLAHTQQHMLLSREQSLQEVLEISFGVLKGDYLTHFGQQLQTASSWQAAEAALFGIR